MDQPAGRASGSKSWTEWDGKSDIRKRAMMRGEGVCMSSLPTKNRTAPESRNLDTTVGCLWSYLNRSLALKNSCLRTRSGEKEILGIGSEDYWIR